MRRWVALYGGTFHLAVIAFALWRTGMRRFADPRALVAMGIAVVLASALVYAVVVAPYVARRGRLRSAVFFDSAVGMLAECAVIAVGSLFVGVLTSTAVLAQVGVVAFAHAVAQSTYVTFLWAYGVALTEILVLGNAAGLVGWWILKKIDARRGRPARVRRAA